MIDHVIGALLLLLVLLICYTGFTMPVAPRRAMVVKREREADGSEGPWLAHFDGVILDENEVAFKMRQHWWNKARWYPKHGPSVRVFEINRLRET